ncbi:MAG: glycosyltransferase involved in cell wall biosynthesis [Afipia broomeae]|jgi:glycosyltransferase involved in cell wall biosynthesis|uniref:glycosyltransferase family 2 protein n=1 Tax=Afipia TaxID=1033 RepID=UPI0009FEF562|nr:glycosyltransferase family 2 protein [Afipia broomeae]RTL81620.1 MAG: glycosyltransferase [Bradyrhizobiaceae bacterium]
MQSGAAVLSKLDRVRDEIDDLFPHSAMVRNRSIAVLLPCYNEETAIAGVIDGFKRALPGARIYVYDNNSTDGTYEAAVAAGAIVRRETLQGKGNVVRRMLADIEADIYILADGDATYDPTAAGALIEALVTRNLDMMVGTRNGGDGAFPRGHRFGNHLFNRILANMFGDGFTDILSGYRVLSRRFAKSFPVTSSGFEIEAELSVHALDLKIATGEMPLPYATRPEGSQSKLRTYRDGTRILLTLIKLYKETRPLRFFSAIGAMLLLICLGLGAPLIVTYLETGLVPRFPTAILAAAIAQLGFLSFAIGLVLEAIAQGRREAKRMRYLDLDAVANKP